MPGPPFPFLVSEPELKLLVRSTADDNHETSLVVPELLQPSVLYCRLLVEENSNFVEHAVAFVESSPPDPTSVIARALQVARPTRVCFGQVNALHVSPALGHTLEPSHLAAWAVSVLAVRRGRARRESGHETAERKSDRVVLELTCEGFFGSIAVREVARFYEAVVELSVKGESFS